MESWPFKVVDDNGNPNVEVSYLGENKQFSPQEISAMVLVKVSRIQGSLEFTGDRTNSDALRK